MSGLQPTAPQRINFLRVFALGGRSRLRALIGDQIAVRVQFLTLEYHVRHWGARVCKLG